LIIEDFEKTLNTQRAIPKIYREWDDANSKSKYSTGNCWTASIWKKKHNLFDPDRITNFISEHVSLERGATVGLAIFLVGFAYSLHLLLNWVSSGYKDLPLGGQDMIGCTLMVIGLQTIFFSFFFSMIGGEE
jgi:hypothetical protein